jgi:LmbE family N-acetylglucosaminyl deacetylase
MTKLLVTVAHPDDETFGTGSVIAAAVQAGAGVTVCCATRGEAGEAHGVPPGADLGAVREAELRAAGEVLGAHRVMVLDFLDSGMDGPPAPGSLAAVSTAEVAERVAAVIGEVRPDVVVTLDPVSGDGHRDHIAIGAATVQACRRFPEVRLYAWTVRRSLIARWFAELEQVRPDMEHLELGLDRDGLGRADSEITAIVDVRHVREVRERASAKHASQQTPFEGMPAELRDEFLDTDHFVLLQPAWGSGELERSIVG